MALVLIIVLHILRDYYGFFFNDTPTGEMQHHQLLQFTAIMDLNGTNISCTAGPEMNVQVRTSNCMVVVAGKWCGTQCDCCKIE